MPYIEVKTNTKITPDTAQTLKSMLARLMEASFPGKTENWLMVNIEDDKTMFFAGNDEPTVMVDVHIFGGQSAESYARMTELVCREVSPLCGVKPDRTYVKYTESTLWGWNGNNF